MVQAGGTVETLEDDELLQVAEKMTTVLLGC